MNKSFLRVLISFFAVAFLLVLFTPKNAKFPYDYRKGQPWKYETLSADFDFPILKTESQIQEERNNPSARFIPYYRYSSDVVDEAVRAVEQMDIPDYKYDVVSELKKLYANGIIGNEGVRTGADREMPDVLYIQKDKRAFKVPVGEVYDLSSARTGLLDAVSKKHKGSNVDSVFRDKGVYALIVPNLSYDGRTTQLLYSEAAVEVSPTSGYVTAGQTIVSKGDLITPEIEQMLDSYKKEYESNLYSGPDILLWTGDIIISLVIVVLLYFAIHFSKPKIIFDDRLYYILLIFLLFSIIPLIIAEHNQNRLFMVPFTLAALFLQAFFRPRLLFPVYAVTLLPILIYSEDGITLYVMFLLAGSLSIFLFQYLGKGWKQFLLAAITFTVLAVLYLTFHWLDMINKDIMSTMTYLFVASLLAVLGYPLIYLFEKIFNLVSNSRLMELCDTSNPLLRQLEQKAPGTFHHSLQVMNMADAAARSIDANPLLVRAAALYHDIGKINNPQCFVENESLVVKEDENKYHTGLSPEQSAHDILRHVPDGYELARSNGLPEKIAEFILTHHGTAVTGYFYNKYLNDGGDPENVTAFSYPGPKPKSKEQVILMLCDSIEAASRTLKDYSQDSCSKLVEGIVSAKMREGQLEDADISIRDLGVVKEELKHYIAQIHHERIVYPKRNKNK